MTYIQPLGIYILDGNKYEYELWIDKNTVRIVEKPADEKEKEFNRKVKHFIAQEFNQPIPDEEDATISPDCNIQEYPLELFKDVAETIQRIKEAEKQWK